jgi:serine protease inhibitor
VSLKKKYTIITVVLVLVIAASVMSYLREEPEEEFIPIEFNALLDLSDDSAVENQIIFYLVNRDNLDDTIKVVNFETIDSQYNITITLQDIRETENSPIENQTDSSQIRFFTASYTDYSKPEVERHLSGWIDEHKHIQEWDVVTINWVEDSSGHGELWIPDRYDIIPESTTVEASNRFALDLYDEINNGNENILFSPYSISTAVSMIYEGARGETAKEIQGVFHLNTNESMRLRENRALYEAMNKHQGAELETANAVWLQTGYPIEENFTTKLKEYYQSEAHQQDFVGDPEAARLVINEWVENRTNNKIENLFPENSINPDVRLVLTNAVYFKGAWLYQFSPDDTKPEPFNVSENQTKTVDMMYLRGKDLNYTEVEGVQILELPYKDRSLSMVLLLPQNRTLAELEQSLTHDKLMNWTSGLGETHVTTYLPKFSFKSNYFLKNTLSEMGMPTAFMPDQADFTGINRGGGLFISKVVHQAFIDVKEEGTEAAAATGIVAELGAEFPSKVFRADHPFIFMILDKQTGSILFIGRVMNPDEGI